MLKFLKLGQSTLFEKLKIIPKLGILNLARVFFYKYFIKSRIKPGSILIEEAPVFFMPHNRSDNLISLPIYSLKYFGWKEYNYEEFPNWHENILTGAFSKDSMHLWNEIPDFDAELGDIKGVWEASRFDWVISFSQHAASGDKKALIILNAWLMDWIEKNPIYKGVNWKCGQEASIRLMHLALASLLLKQTKDTTPALLSLIKAHMKRISPTIMYAIAQDNNHGTSEAAALYIGGSWLVLNGDDEGIKWKRQGRKWLEDRANKLIENDGSFSQYSVTYHRVMLDTYSLVEVWRQKHSLPPFSTGLYTKLKAATDWLFYFTIFESGDSPNLGANDGARLIPLANTDYRDFRPSVQLASSLFKKQKAYKNNGSYNLPLQWLELVIPASLVSSKKHKDFSNGGYAYLAFEQAELFFNYPKFKFRPSQCDALHVDFWLNGQNVLRDGGTFSYNAGKKYIDYYAGVKSHNTIEFDSHEQMPRISRFLLGDWLYTSIKKELSASESSQTITAGYKDRFGCKHSRTIELKPSRLMIQDIVSGFKKNAVLRFRLIPANWQLVGYSLKSEFCTINFSVNIGFKRIELTTGFESRYYYQESEIPVLEIEIDEPGIIITEVKF